MKYKPEDIVFFEDIENFPGIKGIYQIKDIRHQVFNRYPEMIFYKVKCLWNYAEAQQWIEPEVEFFDKNSIKINSEEVELIKILYGDNS